MFKHGEKRHESEDLAVPYGHADIGVILNAHTHISFEDIQEDALKIVKVALKTAP